MPAIIITGEERTVLTADAARANVIADAFRSAAAQVRGMPLPAGIDSRDALGGWVGPAPRITRWHSPSLTNGPNVTHAAWVYRWPDPPAASAEKTNRYVYQSIKSAVADQLARVSNARMPHDGNFVTSWAIYNDTINGPMSWWEGPQASATQTKEAFPQFSMIDGRDMGTRETPDGPGELTITRPTPRIPGLPDPDQAIKILKYTAIIVGVVGVIYLAGPLIRSAAQAGAESVNERRQIATERRRLIRGRTR